MEKPVKLNGRLRSWQAQGDDDVCICALGARTPLGFDVQASAAAVRGAISAASRHTAFMDKNGEPISLAVDTGLDSTVDIMLRCQDLLWSAIDEALAQSAQACAGTQIQCWIGLPEPRPGLPTGLADAVLVMLLTRLGIPATSVHIYPYGHAAGLIALQAAADAVATGSALIGLVAGVDSYHELRTLQWLDRRGRLMSSCNRSGFIPGEGAAACLLARRSETQRLGAAVLARVKSASTAVESQTMRSKRICVGEGLSIAVRGAVSSLHQLGRGVSATYCDLNGERYKSEEFQYVLLRTQDAFVDAHDFICPADCWGDVGAASGVLFACLAIVSCQRGYAKGAFPILWAGSDSGYRTAVVLQL